MPMRRGPRGFGGRRPPPPPMFGPRPRPMFGPRPGPMFGPRPRRYRRSGCGCLPLFLMALPVAAIVGLVMLVL